MATMRTTHEGGGIATNTSAPMSGVGGAFDMNALTALMTRQLARKQAVAEAEAQAAKVGLAERRAALRASQAPTNAPAAGSGYHAPVDNSDKYEDVYYRMAGNGPQQVSGWVEAAPGSPGAVYHGRRLKGTGPKGGGASGGGSGPQYRDPLGDYVTRRTKAAEQQGDGGYIQPVRGTTHGVDLLR